MIATVIVLIHFAATWAMVGLIWLVQLVHYPLFVSIDPDKFSGAMVAHQQRISFIVLPLMGSELLTALLLWVVRPPGVSAILLASAFILLLVAWASTFLIQVPQHTKLIGGHSSRVCTQLVSWNWIRTFSWSARGMIIFAILWQTVSH